MPIAITLLLLLIGAAAVGFYMAWTIGANDVANAMGASVGSGTLTIKRAIIIAGVFEFLGAVLVGAHVTDTVRKGIIDPVSFSSNPSILMCGMFAALVGAAIWITIATYFALPVSTSHAIIGAIVGFGVVAALSGIVSFSAIGFTKLSEIALSWIISPITGGITAYLMFFIIRKKVLHSKHPVLASKKILPHFIFLVFTILCLSIIYKGLKNLGFAEELPPIYVLLISLLVGILAGVSGFIFLKKYKPKLDIKQGTEIAYSEKLFGYLLILTACYIAFAHGANDVANAVGPLAAIVSIAKTFTVEMEVILPIWVLLLGGIGIVVGLSTWGYRVIETIGKRITEITPTQGFSATFGAATTVLICSKLGLPISTSQVLVGAVVGVGLAGGIRALDTKVIGKIIISWIITLPAAAALSAALYLGFLALV